MIYVCELSKARWTSKIFATADVIGGVANKAGMLMGTNEKEQIK
jgi:hypothetical protein